MTSPVNGEEIELIRQHAVLLIQRGEDPAVRVRFQELLQACQDLEGLLTLGEQIRYNPEVSVPLYERGLQLKPEEPELMIRLGTICFMSGEDEAAEVWLERARQAEGETFRVLSLAANLAREDEEKKRIYTRLLEMEPGNKAVFEHLLALRRGKN